MVGADRSHLAVEVARARSVPDGRVLTLDEVGPGPAPPTVISRFGNKLGLFHGRKAAAPQLQRRSSVTTDDP